ncbi:type II toxin-antitoxin system VapC family toxin [Nocardioides sp. L-11A]|uniref:type II toxin-antitoxin system VapC family toxin n=1 Tax=Nocardioides sp. L-11A TaxID=3043848 RepID=UPI00249AEBE6|nr:type II toxin-antitoxin system VapC family toxin [Nocardioides sp. L-11A]
MLALDASAWVHALVDAGARGETAREVLAADPEVVVPAHGPVEVLRTLARLEAVGRLSAPAAGELADTVPRTAIRIVPLEGWLLAEVWSLRHNVSAYDAPYVAIARRFDFALLTADGRLGRAAAPYGVDVRLVE